MNAAQIDQTLEKLMLELQGFKRSSVLLTDAGTKAEEVIAAAEAVLKLTEQIRNDNQRQVEAVEKYTTASEQNLAALVESVTNAQIQQHEQLAALEATVQQGIGTLSESIDASQNRLEEAIDNLEQSMLEQMLEQNRVRQVDMRILIVFMFILLIGTVALLWILLTNST